MSLQRAGGLKSIFEQRWTLSSPRTRLWAGWGRLPSEHKEEGQLCSSVWWGDEKGRVSLCQFPPSPRPSSNTWEWWIPPDCKGPFLPLQPRW